MQCLFHADERLVKSLSLQYDRHNNCHSTWCISQPTALLPLMFHCSATCTLVCSKHLQYVSKQYLIGCPPGVHQQLKMLEPKVRIWFVMWEFAGNFDVLWSIPHPNVHINQLCVRKERIWVHVSTCKHAQMHSRAHCSTVNHKCFSALCEYVFALSSSFLTCSSSCIPLF